MKKENHNFFLTEETGQSEHGWMLTMVDLLSLILTFFVMLYSMSAMRQDDWEKAANSLVQRLNPNRETLENEPAAKMSVTKVVVPKAANPDYLSSVIIDKITGSQKLSEVMSVTYEDEQIFIKLKEKNIFQEGSNQMTESGAQIVYLLGEIIQPVTNRVDVYGNIDEVPINTLEFPSNWELSLSRALVVSQNLRFRGYAYRINSFGRDVKDNTAKSGESVDNSASHIEIIVRRDKAQS